MCVLFVNVVPCVSRRWSRWTSSCSVWILWGTGSCGWGRIRPEKFGPWTSRSNLRALWGTDTGVTPTLMDEPSTSTCWGQRCQRERGCDFLISKLMLNCETDDTQMKKQQQRSCDDVGVPLMQLQLSLLLLCDFLTQWFNKCCWATWVFYDCVSEQDFSILKSLSTMCKYWPFAKKLHPLRCYTCQAPISQIQKLRPGSSTDLSAGPQRVLLLVNKNMSSWFMWFECIEKKNLGIIFFIFECFLFSINQV